MLNLIMKSGSANGRTGFGKKTADRTVGRLNSGNRRARELIAMEDNAEAGRLPNPTGTDPTR